MPRRVGVHPDQRDLDHDGQIFLEADLSTPHPSRGDVGISVSWGGGLQAQIKRGAGGTLRLDLRSTSALAAFAQFGSTSTSDAGALTPPPWSERHRGISRRGVEHSDLIGRERTCISTTFRSNLLRFEKEWLGSYTELHRVVHTSARRRRSRRDQAHGLRREVFKPFNYPRPPSPIRVFGTEWASLRTPAVSSGREDTPRSEAMESGQRKLVARRRAPSPPGPTRADERCSPPRGSAAELENPFRHAMKRPRS